MFKVSNLVAKALFAGAIVCSGAFASDTYISLEGALVKSKLSADGASIKGTPGQIGIKAGVDNENYRIWGGYFYQKAFKHHFSDTTSSSRSKFSYHKFLVGADYTPAISDNLRGIVGVDVGFSMLNHKVDAVLNNVRTHESGTKFAPTIGFGLGILFDINENNQVEFGTRAEFASYKLDERLKASHYGIYAAYNYKF